MVGMTSCEEPSAPANEPMPMTESVSIILRRQVPPRAEAPRSWLGGLPMMPEHVAWPRSVSTEFPERGERALHFMAQIACTDLPPQLWGGLGPRSGWLLLFIDPNHFQPFGPDTLRVMHIETLGTERAAPADLGPVDDGEHSTTNFDYYRSPAEIPSTWRRWPVDIVVTANDVAADVDRLRLTPSRLEKFLHKGQPIAHRAPRDPAPFTWRGALHVLNTIERPLAKPLGHLKLDDGFVSRLRRPGYIDTILLEYDERFAEWFDENRAVLDGPEPAAAKERGHRNWTIDVAQGIRESRAALAAFLERHTTPDAIIDHLHEAHRRYLAWRVAACQRITDERASVLTHDLDTPIPAATWKALKRRLRRDTFRFLTTDYFRKGDNWRYVVLTDSEVTVYPDRLAANFQLVADYYVDARLRKLIPASALSTFEPYYRGLINDLPHRMGGARDAIQPDSDDESARNLLLFQIASDGAMNWWWADVGAYYVYIDRKDFERGDLTKAWLDIETH